VYKRDYSKRLFLNFFNFCHLELTLKHFPPCATHSHPQLRRQSFEFPVNLTIAHTIRGGEWTT
jgi:hypothetical protein